MAEKEITVDVLIEIPIGSRNKYEYDKVKKVGIEGWENKASAIRTIKEAPKRYWDDYNALGTSKV